MYRQLRPLSLVKYLGVSQRLQGTLHGMPKGKTFRQPTNHIAISKLNLRKSFGEIKHALTLALADATAELSRGKFSLTHG